ncbi:UNVERIFIED_CONTAM: hypothetical protein Sradi_3329700 [Sesamum radiatum]|uniref:Uncharacterized protein n=1 Tax=Sesamum radiatum TaxID=300843 RepID=A0AAW2R2A1_SESRA
MPTNQKVKPWSWAAHRFDSYESTPESRSETFQVKDLKTSIEGFIETCTKYCSRVSSAGDIGRLCSFSGLVGKVVN